MTDEAILQLTSQGRTREEGFRQLVIKYQQRLYQLVRSKVSCHEDADDVLQNTFIKIFRHIRSYEGRSELFTWMYRIALNEIINHHRQLERIKKTTSEQTQTGKADPYINPNEVSDNLEKAVSGLPERQQAVFRMRYYDELSYHQIAEILQVTEGALKASFHHAVKKIEEEIRSKQIL